MKGYAIKLCVLYQSIRYLVSCRNSLSAMVFVVKQISNAVNIASCTRQARLYITTTYNRYVSVVVAIVVAIVVVVVVVAVVVVVVV